MAAPPGAHLQPPRPPRRASCVTASQIWFVWRVDNRRAAQHRVIAGPVGVTSSIFDHGIGPPLHAVTAGTALFQHVDPSVIAGQQIHTGRYGGDFVFTPGYFGAIVSHGKIFRPGGWLDWLFV